MLAHMKMQTTGALTEICLTLPTAEAEHFYITIEQLLKLAKLVPYESLDEENISALDMFPDASPAKALRGLRVREGLTQGELANQLGISQARVSELETGARAISVDMAKRIAEVYNTSYKIFL